MRLALRCLGKAPNQSSKAGMWQDPLRGYWESHGKMEFKQGEEYNMSDKEKLAVLERYRMKEIFKKEFIRQQFDPVTFKYREGVLIDPAMFRWYACDMTRQEHFMMTPKSIWVYFGLVMAAGIAYVAALMHHLVQNHVDAEDGSVLWWDRTIGREDTAPGNKMIRKYHAPW